MPFDSSSTLAPYAAYVCTDQGATVAQAVLNSAGGAAATVYGGGLSGAARVATGTAIATTVLAEIGNIPVEMACECVTEISRTGATVIVLGAQTDIDTYRALRRAGAAEYFTHPVTAEEILSVQPQRAATDVVVQLPKAPIKSPSIAVMGSNGGVGASLLAQNLAFHAAAGKGANLRTALLDADIQFGSQAIDLDRDETAGLFEALMAPDRIDDTFVTATMEHLTARLSLYSHQIGAGQDAAPYENGLPRLLPRLRAEFDALVTDLPRAVMMQRGDVAAHFDALVLVIPAGFSGVNAASRLIKRIGAQAPDLRILPVLSELRRDAGLSRKDIETTIGRPVVAVLPRCDAPMARAQRAAQPLVETQPRGAYAKAVARLWTAAHAGEKPTEVRVRRPLIRRIFG